MEIMDNQYYFMDDSYLNYFNRNINVKTAEHNNEQNTLITENHIIK